MLLKIESKLTGTLEAEHAPDLAPVEIDVPRIKQVFLNLINNAVYVMKDTRGSLTTVRLPAKPGTAAEDPDL